MKNFAIATLLGSVISGASVAQNLPELDRQLTIMSGVIDTALKQDTRKDNVRYRGIDATYLAKQGVVFTIKTGGRSMIFDFDLGDLISGIPAVPHAPSVEVITNGDYEVVYENDWEETADRVIRKVEHIVRETEDKMREFRSDRREVDWEIRELERRNRDLEFELRTADEERKKVVEEELKEMEQELDRLETKQAALEERTQALAKEKQEEIAKKREAQKEAYKTFLANFEASIGDTMCSFGAGLRELPDNEHITFVLSDFARDEENHTQDRVYIFSKKNVKRCVTEDIKPSDLLAKAEVYTF